MLVRPAAQPDEPVVHAAEPRHLQQLVARDVEHEGGDAEAEQLGEDQHDDGRQPLALGEQIDFEEFQRQQDDEGNDEDDQRRPGRQVFDQRAPVSP